MGTQLTNHAWSGVLQGLAGMRKSNLSALGANVILCSGPVKINLHEILARRFTKIFDLFMTELDLQDENGAFVFILPDINSRSLRALSELLYTGKAVIKSETVMSDLDNLLTKELSCSVVLDTSEPMADEIEETKYSPTETQPQQPVEKVDFDDDLPMDIEMEDSKDFKDDIDYKCEVITVKKEPNYNYDEELVGANSFTFDKATLEELGREPNEKEKRRLYVQIGSAQDESNVFPYACLVCGKKTKKGHQQLDHVRSGH